MAKTPRIYREVLAEHRARLERLAERRTIARLKKLYDQGVSEVEVKLAKALRGGLGDKFTGHQLRIILVQLRQGQLILGRRLKGELDSAARDAQVDSLRGLGAQISKLEKSFHGAELILPIDHAAHLANLVGKRKNELDSMHAKALDRWGKDAFNEVHKQLALSLAIGENVGTAMTRVPTSLADQWWKAERIARTETVWAVNVSHMDAIADTREILPDLMARWNEHVDDDTFAPMDDRVGVDSIAMHGQVARPGALFRMPAFAPAPDADGETQVSKSLVGKGWTHPPNRPNDRAVLTPWRPGWGTPSWQYVGGDRSEVI